MAIWGLNVTVVKQLTESFDSALLAALRMAVAFAALTGIVIWKRCAFAALTRKQLGSLLLCSVLMVYLNQLLFAEGLLRSTATNGALIMALSPLVSALLAVVVFRESLSLQRLCGVALGFGGVAAVVLSHPGAGLSRAGTGDLMLIGAVVSFATGGAIVQRLSREIHPLAISWAIYLAGTSLLIAQVGIASGAMNLAAIFPGWRQWALILFSGVMATAASNLVWNRAIAAIGVARTAVFLYWVPIFGVLCAALLLGERLTLWHLAGFAAVMAGTYLGTRPRTPAPPPIA
ncbi:MAG: DMT family transporter [Gammaproteobacteria bacterium]|nr:DMT family transporter [Gammaproteobacteria bacterium]MBU1441761.1 DMT family transporter [Gammaproteobacteria bacterium]MBU2286021.1 DMT family transporter [Gammaproteobacteria bacterium]MBU2410497.1 DMT family transporter [Gammaproteobacteria bacterium]